MKKIICLLSAVSLLLLSGCSTKTINNDKIIAASFYPVYIFTLNITDGIGGLRVESIAEQNTGCLHDYTLTAKDAKILNDASVLIINGAQMEGFTQDLKENGNNISLIDSSVNCDFLCSLHHHHDGEENEEHEGHESVNSHIWMSVDNAIIQARNIKDGLSKEFPEYRSKFEENFSEYEKRLQSLKDEMNAAREFAEGKNVISFHNAYAYLENDLGFKIIENIETDEGGEPSAKKIGDISDRAKAGNVKALFVETYYEGSAAEIISRETEIPIYKLNPVTTGEKSKTAYEEIMRENIKVILKAVS